MLSDLVGMFPNLATEPYIRTSPCTFDYNCFAYAGGDQSRRWDPGADFHWPDAARNTKIATLTRIYKGLGFKICQNGDIEVGYDKIVIYAIGNNATHAAKQLSTGEWSSKLGDLEDISHTLTGIAGGGYGTPTRFMKRESQSSSQLSLGAANSPSTPC